MRKRILSLLCALALCLTLLPAPALAADAPVSYLGWNTATNSHEMASCDDYTVVTAETTEWNTGWYVVNTADPLWINGRIEVNGDVSLILTDGAFLEARGIHVGPNDSLTIYGQSAGTGRLSASSGMDSAGQAVIGGNAEEAGGTIAIHGGNINVQSDKHGMDVGGVGAGIGGGANGAGGSITITGGMIRATGGRADTTEGEMSGAGIGGGSGGDSGTITITGGQIEARSSGMGVAGIGAGSGGTNGTITITGGYFYEGDLMQNTVSGVQVAEGLSVILQNIDNQMWYMVTDQVGELTISGGTDGTDYTWENGVITVLTSTPLTISGNGMVCKERIVVGSTVSAQLTISNVNIFTQSAPLEIPAGSSLSLTLTGENTLKTSEGSGILNRGSVTIAGSGALDTQGFSQDSVGIDNTNAELVIEDGVITAVGGYQGAGVGGGDITISGGTVKATGQWHSAGIGGSTVVITGGMVEATGGAWGAGISGAAGSSVKISGGEVVAKGGSNSGAGIGGFGGSAHIGHAESGGTIEITGGIVYATANRGAGIGGGGHTSSSSTQWGDGGTITISGGVVTASSQYGAGIGGGSVGLASEANPGGGAGGDIIISGGTVTATSGREGVGIGGGSVTANSGTFSTGTNGNAVIITTAISDQSGTGTWNGIFFEGDADGQIYGSAVSPQEDFTIPEDKNLVIGSDQTLTIPSGVSVTNNGTITAAESSSLINNGVLINNGTAPAEIEGTGITVNKVGTTVTIQQDGNTVTVTLPESGGMITPNENGTITLPSGSTVQTGNGLEIIVSGENATITPSGEVSLPGGGSVTVTDGEGNQATITLPESGGTIIPNENGTITLPSGSTVQTGNGPEITVSDENATATPAGEVSLSGGGSVTVTDDEGNQATVTLPESGGMITPNENGTITLPGGSTVQTGNGLEIIVSGENATITPSGEVSLPGGGSVTVNDGSGNTATITVPENGGTIIPNEDGSVTLPGGSSVTVPDGAGGTTTVTVPDGGGVLEPSTGMVTRYYTVTFDSQGGSPVASIVVAENTCLTKPTTDPTRDGYTFTGWYQDAACTDAWVFATTPVTTDIILYAGWKQDSSSGGSSGSSSNVTGSSSDVSVSVSGDSVTSSQMVSAVNKADEGSTITLKATGSISISLPVDGMAAAADNGNDILIALRYGEITLSAQAIAGLTDGISSNAKIKIAITSQTSSKDETISDLLDKGAAVFDVSVEVGGESVHSLDGSLTLTFTVSNLPEISDPNILHILTDGTREYYAPDSIIGNTITVKGIRNLSTFAVIPGGEVPEEQTNPFTDVYESHYYYDAVLWAAANGVTSGTSITTFSPNAMVTRAQMVAFLWRAHGSPKATGTNPFTDVDTSDYYYDAVLWAVANGVTVGTSATTFSPDAPVSRAQAVTFQWRTAGSPVVSGYGFNDVAANTYYVNAVSWAAANGITAGTSATTFSPDVVVSRAQAVTFLYREQE